MLEMALRMLLYGPEPQPGLIISVMVQSARNLGDSDPLVTATEINGGVSNTPTLTKHRPESISLENKHFASNDLHVHVCPIMRIIVV